MKWQFRVVYRLREEYRTLATQEQWILYSSNANPMGRPYTNAQAVKGIVSTQNNCDFRYEYKAQRFPLTQQWEDLDV